MAVSLTRFAWLSIAAAVCTMALKLLAWWLTGSVGLLSDALESVVNLVGATMALAMLTVAAKPPDQSHAFGHGKAEYFASGVEGALILLAAVGIGWAAVDRLVSPAPTRAGVARPGRLHRGFHDQLGRRPGVAAGSQAASLHRARS